MDAGVSNHMKLFMLIAFRVITVRPGPAGLWPPTPVPLEPATLVEELSSSPGTTTMELSLMLCMGMPRLKNEILFD